MILGILSFFNLTILPVGVLFLSCTIGIGYWNRLPKPLKTLTIFLIFNFCIEVGARVAGYYFKQNLPLLHLYTLGEFLLLSLYYRQILSKSSIFSQYFKWILIGGMGVIVLNTICFQGIFEFNSYSKTLVNVIIILYALDYAFRFSDLTDIEPTIDKALRWINAAVLLYYCGSIFIFMSSQFELETGGALQILWQINAVLNLIFHITILISLWKVVYPPRKSSSSPLPES